MSGKGFEVKVVKCPFNPQHVLTSDRLQHHIIKCMKNYPNHYTCPYFAQHKFIKQADYAAHILECPMKIEFESSTVKPGYRQPDPVKINVPESDLHDDDW